MYASYPSLQVLEMDKQMTVIAAFVVCGSMGKFSSLNRADSGTTTSAHAIFEHPLPVFVSSSRRDATDETFRSTMISFLHRQASILGGWEKLFSMYSTIPRVLVVTRPAPTNP